MSAELLRDLAAAAQKLHRALTHDEIQDIQASHDPEFGWAIAATPPSHRPAVVGGTDNGETNFTGYAPQVHHTAEED